MSLLVFIDIFYENKQSVMFCDKNMNIKLMACQNSTRFDMIRM